MDKPALSNLLLFSLVQHPAVFNNSFTTYFLPCFVLLLFLFFSCCRCSACNVWQLERQIAPKSLRSSCRSTFCFCLSFSPSADLIGLDCLGFRLDGRASCFIGLGLSKRLACSWLTFIDLASLCLFLSLSLSLSLPPHFPLFFLSLFLGGAQLLPSFRNAGIESGRKRRCQRRHLLRLLGIIYWVAVANPQLQLHYFKCINQ